jgi:hypothetical protein
MKSNKAEIEKRVKEILDLILAGAEFWEICQYASENAWNVGERQVRRYVAQAYDSVAAEIEKDRGRLINRHLAQRRSLYARCLNTGDYRTALAVLKDEAELQAMYPATELKHSGGLKVEHGGHISAESLNDPEAADLAHRLLERLAAGQTGTNGLGHARQPPMDAGPTPGLLEP